jgi:tRNA-Thr(GGU) m(6)t(6)A37 methyltransferase TsaA
MEILLKPIAIVINNRKNLSDDYWGNVVSEIILDESIPTESLIGIEEFSHIEIIFYFHQAQDQVKFSRHPRGNKNLPETGIFAQRAKDRPNRLGVTIARLIKREGRILTVDHFDGMDGTPVIDIKPVMKTFLVNKNEVTEPRWVKAMLTNYWKE